MKKIGTLNSRLSGVIAAMGHTDQLVICDSGLRVPRGMRCIDLAVAENIPRFIEVVNVVLQELQVESAIIAEEMEVNNNCVFKELMQLLSGIEIKRISHEEFKNVTAGNNTMAFVRTGEASPFANVILISGVTFNGNSKN